MCGIAGILRKAGAPPPTYDDLRPMLQMIHHRGPDEKGHLVQGPLAMGMRRLAIIDLSSGSQPIFNEDRTIAVVFNGEIYNYRELRAELTARGHQFRTESDTETIVHGWEEWGQECVLRLRGMFAFSLYDSHRALLFCARDRVGKKPFFYQIVDDEIRWASEIRGLLAASGVAGTPSPEGLAQFFYYGYSAGPTTCYEGIRRLPPAHHLTWQNGRLSVSRYWMPSPKSAPPAPTEELMTRTRELVQEATRIRLVSDVPLGAMLSGGLDSSVVVGIMARESETPVKTFTVGFEDPSFDERRYGRLVARHFGTEHHEQVVTEKELMAAIPRMVWHLEEPNIDEAFLPAFYVARMCRQHVTVALNGDGGDEAFGGYGRYEAALLAEKLRWLPRPLLVAAQGAVQILRSSRRNYELRGRALRLLEALLEQGDMRHVAMLRAFSPQWSEAILDGAIGRRLREQQPADVLLAHLAALEPGPTVSRLAASDYLQHLPDQLLVKADRSAMANSLEGRSPLLDPHVIEFALGLPDHVKIRGGTRKWLLRQAFADLLPPEVLSGRKRAFNVPLGQWFAGDFGTWAEKVLLSPRALDRGLVRREGVQRLFAEHRSRRANHAKGLWGLLLVELWHRMFVDAPPPASPPPLEAGVAAEVFGT